MKWDSSFAIGIEAIDNQHKKIFEHLLAIENSVAKRDPWHILNFFMSQLTEYMKFHLAVEEAMLEVIRYPDRENHCAAHAKLLEQMAELEEQLKKGTSGQNLGDRPASSEKLVSFFEAWFIRHVLSSDREYAAYLADRFPAPSDRQP